MCFSGFWFEPFTLKSRSTESVACSDGIYGSFVGARSLGVVLYKELFKSGLFCVSVFHEISQNKVTLFRIRPFQNKILSRNEWTAAANTVSNTLLCIIFSTCVKGYKGKKVK